MAENTIFALATGSARAGIAIIRVSGPSAGAVLKLLAGADTPTPRRASLATFKSLSGEILDQGLYLWFPGPASFTGEDVVEFHIHGGRAVIDSILETVGQMQGCRPAEPGEFTRRAFESGKLDLTEVEGLADLVAADTEAQRRQALAQMQGALGQLYESWRERLLRIQARVEAEIDFSDQDLPPNIAAALKEEARQIFREIATHLDDRSRGERVRDGIKVVIVGAPNVGKSTLLNVLAGRDAAIVADTPGTTRDVVEVRLDLGGFPVILSDTAGIRDSSDPVEVEGIRRTWARVAEADYVLAVFDARTLPALDPEVVALVDRRTIPVLNKIDLCETLGIDAAGGIETVSISARNGDGIDRLLDRLEARVKEEFAGIGPPSLTRVRHRQALNECISAISRFINIQEPELAAEELRAAAHCLGRITGRVDVEEVLSAIFRDFCIGK